MIHRMTEPWTSIIRWRHRPYYQQYEMKIPYDKERGDMQMTRMSYEDRNQELIGCGNALLAIPDKPEHLRSGTWMTVRFARKIRLPIYIIWPDGRVRYEYVPVENRIGSLL